MLEVYLARMECESETYHEKISNESSTRFQVFFIGMNEDEVIYISSIIFHFQSFLHECVELMRIDIGEELTREIADRETTSRSSIEQTLVMGQSYPIYSLPCYDHSLSYICEDDSTDKIEHDFLLIWVDISHNQSLNFLPQYLPIDTHEKS